LTEERDQLWAEALAAFRAGEPWWLSAPAEGERAETSENFRVTDPWEEAISAWIDTRPPDTAKTYTTRHLLTTVLSV
ncbi:virulence-associated E family protein, partial [Caballeronia sp. INML1]|uniref:virulence-associated E family protein n=1 Tax=Caballeronia sp. INML1 TaxID=2921760 RepID=UPI002027C235